MGTLIHIVIIWLVAWIALLLTRNFLTAFRVQVIGRITKPTDNRRVDTLNGVFRHAANIVIVGVALLLSLSEVGVSITPMLATAGVAGIAIGFGAQSLVRDFFSGLFLLIENQVSEGDVIEAAGKSGTVEEVTLRHIRIRDDDGSLHFIPNGIITVVTNKSRSYAFAVIDLNVPRREDPDRVLASLRDIGRAMRSDPVFGPDMIADVEVAGIEKMDDAVMTVRCRLKVLPLRQAPVRREFLRRARLALDHAGATQAATISEVNAEGMKTESALDSGEQETGRETPRTEIVAGIAESAQAPSPSHPAPAPTPTPGT